MSSDAGLTHWLNARKSAWQELAQLTARLQRGRKHQTQDALAAIEGYRGLGRDLSIARRVLPGSRVTQSIEALYARLHATLYRAPRNWNADLRTFFRDEVPQVARELRRYILWVTSLFILSTGAGWWLIHTYPELISLIASEELITSVENGHLWTEGLLNVMPSSILSLQILANNIMVSFAALVFGLMFGLGTFYIITMNGLMLGGIFAFTGQHGLDGELLKFVMAHGCVELSVICIAGAAGMALGAAIAVPTHDSRRESFRHAASQVGKLVVFCALLLIGCGFIEGYVSPDPSFSMTSRIVIGVSWWIIMLTALTGHLFRRL